jgi:hypothetical protein
MLDSRAMSGTDAKKRWARLSATAAVLLAVAQLALLATTAWDKLDTKDEPHYLAGAVQLWMDPGTRFGCDAPALPKWGFALPLRLLDPRLFDPSSGSGRDPLWSRPPEIARRNLLAARSVTILVTVLGGLFLWLTARRFGAGVALVTHALWCLSPAVLAQGCLATLDGWVSGLLCVAAWGAVRAYERPSPWRLLTLGVALALAAACKAPALGFVPIAVGLAAWSAVRAARDDRTSVRRAPIMTLLLIGAAFGVTLAAVYGLRIGTLDVGDPCGRSTQPVGPVFGPLPCVPWLASLVVQWQHGQGGHLGYLFGQPSGRGWWWFYLAALALKTTLGSQALALLRAAAWIKRWPDRRSLMIDAVILAYPAVLITVMSLGSAQNGLRYILPAFPFLMLAGGRALPDLSRAFGRAGVTAGALALTLGLVEMLSVHPHHLMFFNAWAGGPRGGPRYLINGDDWGQDQRRVAEWQRLNRPGRFFYTQYTDNPRHWGIAFETPPCEPRQGFYALQAVEVHRPKRLAPGCLDWLTVEEPDARWGYSVYFYAVNRARLEQLKRERGSVRPFWESAGTKPSPETEGEADSDAR